MNRSEANDDELRWRDRIVGNAQAPLPEPWFIRDARERIPEAPTQTSKTDPASDVLPMLPPWQPEAKRAASYSGGSGDWVAEPVRQSWWWLYAIGGGLLVLIAMALWLAANPKLGGAPPTVVLDDGATAKPSIPVQRIADCAAPQTIAGLRDLIVGMARTGGGDRRNGLDSRLASLSVSVAAAPDATTGDGRGVSCRGSATYQPADAAAATTTMIAYRVRPAAAGAVSISMLSGVGPIVTALTQADPVSAEPVAAAPAPTVQAPTAPLVSAPVVARSEPVTAPTVSAPPPRRLPRSAIVLESPAPRVRFANPSFDCRRVTSQVLRTICASEELSALDRDMSDLFYAVRETADDRIIDELEAGRSAFIARRQRCDSEACIARTYEERMAEITDYR